MCLFPILLPVHDVGLMFSCCSANLPLADLYMRHTSQPLMHCLASESEHHLNSLPYPTASDALTGI